MNENALYIQALRYSFSAVVQMVRVVKGRGDVFDTSGRIASVKGAALSMPPGGTSEGTVNLGQENEDLKVRSPCYPRSVHRKSCPIARG